MAKTEVLHIRLTTEEKERIRVSAQTKYLDSSTWARMVIMRAVDKSEHKREKKRASEAGG